MSQLSQNLGKKFLVTCEITPPRGPDLTEFLTQIEKINKFKSKISGVNVVDIPGSKLLMSSLFASILVKENDLEPIMHVTCRDRNQLALQADLISAAAFEIENILALTGDHPQCKSSDHPKAKPVFDLDSSTLIHTLKLMNQGQAFSGKKLNQKTNFFIGAGLNPSVDPLEGEIYKTKRKLNLGAEFFQTQVIFETKVIEDFLSTYHSLFGEDPRNKIIVGLIPPHNYETIKFLKSMPGLVIPEKIVSRIKKSPHPDEEGVSISLELMDSLREMNLAGVYLNSAGKIDLIEKLIYQI